MRLYKRDLRHDSGLWLSLSPLTTALRLLLLLTIGHSRLGWDLAANISGTPNWKKPQRSCSPAVNLVQFHKLCKPLLALYEKISLVVYVKLFSLNFLQGVFQWRYKRNTDIRCIPWLCVSQPINQRQNRKSWNSQKKIYILGTCNQQTDWLDRHIC